MLTENKKKNTHHVHHNIYTHINRLQNVEKKMII